MFDWKSTKKALHESKKPRAFYFILKREKLSFKNVKGGMYRKRLGATDLS